MIPFIVKVGPGVALGVTDCEFDGTLSPIAFTAFNTTLYAVPFVRPVTTIGLLVDAGLLVIKVDPLSVEYL